MTPTARKRRRQTSPLRPLAAFGHLHDVVGDVSNDPFAVDDVVEHVAGAKVANHPLFVVEPLDVGPACFGESHGMSASEFAF